LCGRGNGADTHRESSQRFRSKGCRGTSSQSWKTCWEVLTVSWRCIGGDMGVSGGVSDEMGMNQDVSDGMEMSGVM
jgi:hypothetical protein